MAATAKHYALNNVEQDRTGISSNVSDDDLFDYYTAQFKSLIEKSHVAGPDDVVQRDQRHARRSANTYTTDQIAQRTYGFGGYITSDCGAVGTTYQSFPSGHDWAPPGWTTDHKGGNATWTNTATGQKVSGAGRRPGVRAARGHQRQLHRRGGHPQRRAGDQGRRPQRGRHRQRAGAPVHRPDADR